MWPGRGRECSLLHLLDEGFSLGKGRYSLILAGGWGAGVGPHLLSGLEVRLLWSWLLLQGEFAATLKFCPSLVPYHGWASAHQSNHDWDLTNTWSHWEGLSSSTRVPQGKTQDPDLFPLSRGSISHLLSGAQLPPHSPSHFLPLLQAFFVVVVATF